MANLSVRLIVRTRVSGMAFFVACIVIYYYVKLGSCLSYVAAALGLLPMHFVMTSLIIVMLYMFMPKDPDAQDQVLQVRVSSSTTAFHTSVSALKRLLRALDFFHLLEAFRLFPVAFEHTGTRLVTKGRD